jgi:hypothetical protein
LRKELYIEVEKTNVTAESPILSKEELLEQFDLIKNNKKV